MVLKLVDWELNPHALATNADMLPVSRLFLLDDENETGLKLVGWVEVDGVAAPQPVRRP